VSAADRVRSSVDVPRPEDPEWERLIERLAAIADGAPDRTVTLDDARMLLDRIGALQLWALERLAADFAEAVFPA
jgi:hypothetical protein